MCNNLTPSLPLTAGHPLHWESVPVLCGVRWRETTTQRDEQAVCVYVWGGQYRIE